MRKRTLQAEIGLLGDENDFQVLAQNGLVHEETDGVVFSGYNTLLTFPPPTNICNSVTALITKKRGCNTKSYNYISGSPL